jgi:gag-polypeptide of LTR copia-type
MKCEDNSNVHIHLETLIRMQEQLAEMNPALTNNNLVTIILSSLPKSYHSLINAITMSVVHAKAKLEPDQVVSMLIDKFEWLTIEEHQLKVSENALTAEKGCEKLQACSSTASTTKTNVESCKCRKKGHMKAYCCSKAKKRDKKEGGLCWEQVH